MNNDLKIITSEASNCGRRVRHKTPSQKLKETLIFSRRIRKEESVMGGIPLMQFKSDVPTFTVDRDTEK
tara:strand:+ start:162 stop:368 length:207 start_codon:yes stop_codon:yes gene_type:complete